MLIKPHTKNNYYVMYFCNINKTANLHKTVVIYILYNIHYDIMIRVAGYDSKDRVMCQFLNCAVFCEIPCTV